jgi:hypothetical protein
MRKVITYSTLGDNMKEVNSAATTWGELQVDLSRAGVRFEGLRAMTNPGQVTLESLQAELPQGEFQLFLMPQKVKSGYGFDEESEEDDMIDENEGIVWDEVDWSTEDPEGFIFRTSKDLAIARVKRAFYLLDKSIDYLTSERPSAPKSATGDPMLQDLRKQAEALQRNMQMFD